MNKPKDIIIPLTTDKTHQVCNGPCGEDKPISEYYTYTSGGKRIPKTICKRCELDRQKAKKKAAVKKAPYETRFYRTSTYGVGRMK